MEQTIIQEKKRDYAVLVGLRSPVLGDDSADEESLAELAALVDTAGGQAVGTILQSRDKPDPHSFIGEGKVEEVRRMVQEENATMVIFDNDLSPSQLRVLTEMTGVQVLDRSGLILDIFAQRARTREGRLQVELAQYQYLLPRLIGMWTHLERQGGTSGKGPIGSKGPGETQLETDRRHIRRRPQSADFDFHLILCFLFHLQSFFFIFDIHARLGRDSAAAAGPAHPSRRGLRGCPRRGNPGGPGALPARHGAAPRRGGQ